MQYGPDGYGRDRTADDCVSCLVEAWRPVRILCSSPLLQQSRYRPNGRTGGPERHHCRYVLRKDRTLQNAFHASGARDAWPTRPASLLPSTSQLVAGTGTECRPGARRLRRTGLPSRQLWWHNIIVMEWPLQRDSSGAYCSATAHHVNSRSLGWTI